MSATGSAKTTSVANLRYVSKEALDLDCTMVSGEWIYASHPAPSLLSLISIYSNRIDELAFACIYNVTSMQRTATPRPWTLAHWRHGRSAQPASLLGKLVLHSRCGMESTHHALPLGPL